MSTFLVTEQRSSNPPRLQSLLQDELADPVIHSTAFRDVYRVEVEGDTDDLARAIRGASGDCLGHVTALVENAESTVDAITEEAVKVATEHVGKDDTYSFRLQKRGSHWLDRPTPELERKIGGAIWEALRDKHGAEPRVNLETPSITIRAEVLGPTTGIGIARAIWLLDSATTAPEPSS